MDLADLRGGEGIEVAAAEMIIMRADDDVFVGLARQPCEHIVDRGARGFDVDVKGQVKCVGERERCGLGGGVDLLLSILQRFSRGLKPRFRNRILRLHHDNANIFRATDAAEAGQQIFFSVAQFAVEHDHGFRSVIAGIDGLGNELRVLRESVVAAFFREARGFVAEHDHDFVFDIEPGVVVIVEFVGGGAVSRKDEGSRHLAGGGEAERDKILIDLQIVPGTA